MLLVCLFLFPSTLGETLAVALEPAEEVTAKKKHFTKQRRVVVTGMGVVTPLGHDPEVFYNNLLDGVSGVSEIETFDCSQFPTVGHTLNICLQTVLALDNCLIIFHFFRESRERLSPSQLRGGLHQNYQRGWTNLCSTCSPPERKLWLMVDLLKMS